ncbi:type III secretion system chaperone [Pseudomonas sp. FP1742]|uniref:type III secretion system chaperone n=1 Tax=Pseudomonas sp. FP1742 TaxID=2954079 RepID=UPI002732E19F|nr:type III secretion system chaperone [Pseudomonas sp. FP1742]WLG48111.1 type III secretion system chaperone [Pseudomonas sp. FP1742]
MKSAELSLTVERWLDSGEHSLSLAVDSSRMSLQRRGGGVLCCAMLSTVWRGDDTSLEAALRLCGPSLGRFVGALALDPQERRLCLLQRLMSDDSSAIIRALESLANQRDVWQALLAQAPAATRRPDRPTLMGRPYV